MIQFIIEHLGEFVTAIIAWRGGKVIDLYGFYFLMQNSGYSGDSLLQAPLLVGGCYRPIGAAMPGGQISVDSKFVYFGN